MKSFNEKYGSWAIITGASSGLGKEMATQLAEQGMNLVLVARRLTRLEEIKIDLQHRHSVEIRVIQADLSMSAWICKFPIW